MHTQVLGLQFKMSSTIPTGNDTDRQESTVDNGIK